MNAGYHNPTAQSTPVTGVRKNGMGVGVGAVSSMLTTPNNSVLSLMQEAEANTAGGFGDINTPKSSHSQRNSPVRNQAKLSDAPRTPTPFKRALADVYQRGEPLSNTVGYTLSHILCFSKIILFLRCKLCYILTIQFSMITATNANQACR